MTIKEIAYDLNRLSTSSNHPFGEIQQLRKKFKGLKKNAHNPFTENSIKSNYAFHSGGRNEVQFNIGKGFHIEKKCLRYGIAFSLEKGPGLFYPVETFSNKIERHNEFVKKNPNYFNGYILFVHDNNFKHHVFKGVSTIQPKFIEVNNFIFIGKRIKKDKVN